MNWWIAAVAAAAQWGVGSISIQTLFGLVIIQEAL